MESRPRRVKHSASKPIGRGQKRPASGSAGSSQPPQNPNPPPPGPSDLVASLRAGLADASFICERGMRLEPHKQEWSRYKDLVYEMGWGLFIRPPQVPELAIVREFYANLPERADNRVMVFGVRVDMGSSAINAHYNLQDDSDEWYKYNDLEKAFDYGRIEHTLSLGRGLKMMPGRWHRRTVYANSLCNEAQVWLKFIRRRIFGISNESDTTVLHQRFLYLLVAGQKINVGRHIYRTICAKGEKMKKGTVDKKFGLPFPSLITELCLQAGVVVPPNSMKGEVATDITTSAVRKDKNQSLRDFWVEHWAGEGAYGWVRPKIRREPGDNEIQLRKAADAAADIEYMGDPEEEPDQHVPETGPSFSAPRDHDMPQAPQAGTSETAGPSGPTPSANFDFWSQPGWQSYLEQQEGQWVQTQQYWSENNRRWESMEHRVEHNRRQVLELDDRQRRNLFEMEQRQTRNLQRLAEFNLQLHMQQMNLNRDAAPQPPNFEWPPPYGPQ